MIRWCIQTSGWESSQYRICIVHHSYPHITSILINSSSSRRTATCIIKMRVALRKQRSECMPKTAYHRIRMRLQCISVNLCSRIIMAPFTWTEEREIALKLSRPRQSSKKFHLKVKSKINLKLLRNKHSPMSPCKRAALFLILIILPTVKILNNQSKQKALFNSYRPSPTQTS